MYKPRAIQIFYYRESDSRLHALIACFCQLMLKVAIKEYIGK